MSTCMAPNSEPVVAEIAGYLGGRLGQPVTFIAGIPWQERERRLDAGEIDLCWICGLPYVLKADRPQPQVELLAAPVFQGERYQGQPVYYSDVIVHRDSPYREFGDLRGAAWAYNEPRSHSGYNITRYQLARMGATAHFFGRVAASGSHQNSLRMVLDGSIDATAIDTTVLDLELARDPCHCQPDPDHRPVGTQPGAALAGCQVPARGGESGDPGGISRHARGSAGKPDPRGRADGPVRIRDGSRLRSDPGDGPAGRAGCPIKLAYSE